MELKWIATRPVPGTKAPRRTRKYTDNALNYNTKPTPYCRTRHLYRFSEKLDWLQAIPPSLLAPLETHGRRTGGAVGHYQLWEILLGTGAAAAGQKGTRSHGGSSSESSEKNRPQELKRAADS